MARRIKIPNVKVATMTVWSQIYLLPTVRVTYDKFLYGFYNIEFWWLKWGFEIIISEQDDFTEHETM